MLVIFIKNHVLICTDKVRVLVTKNEPFFCGDKSALLLMKKQIVPFTLTQKEPKSSSHCSRSLCRLLSAMTTNLRNTLSLKQSSVLIRLSYRTTDRSGWREGDANRSL